MQLLCRQQGQTTTEYAVVLTVMLVGVIAAIAILAAALSGRLEFIAGILPG